MKIKIILIASLIFVTAYFPTFAAGTDIAYEKVNPGSLSYTLKRLKEKTLLLVFSPIPSRKSKIYESLLGARLAELKKVVDEKDVTQIEKTSQRYSATAGEYTDHVLGKDMSNKNNAKNLLEEQRAHIESFLLNFDGTTAQWRFIKHDLDYLDLNLEKLQK